MKKIILALVATTISVSGFSADVIVGQKDKKFDKPEITIKKGDTVKFKNNESNVTHNVFSLGPANAFELKTQAPGTESPVTFNDVGETEIECAIHPTMKLKVKVVEK